MFEKIKSNLFFILLALLAVAALGRYLYKKPNVVNGETAPVFTSMRLNGDGFDFSTMRGRYVLLDFWGSWCAPCLAEAPALKQLHERFHDQKFKYNSK